MVEQIRKRLMEELEQGTEYTDEEVLELIDRIVLEEGRKRRLTIREKEELRKDLFSSVRKLDVLQELMDDPEISEVMVNGYQKIFYEKNGRLQRWERHFSSSERLEDVIQQIVGRANRAVNEGSPIADARLPDGSRVNVVLPPAALDGPILTIRRFPEEPVTMEKLIALGSLTKEAADFLRDLVEARYSILIGGGTSTGKTTFLNALSGYIPADERIITIEDNAELQIQGIDNLVRLEARTANLEGSREISIRDLIRSALRMRPDRIIVGEVRGAEASDFLICLNTGHDGSLGTVHANSVRDTVSRLEMMVLMGETLPIGVIARQITAGVEILIQLSRDALGKRQVEEIAEITGIRREEPLISTLFSRTADGELIRRGELKKQGKMEKLYERRKRAAELCTDAQKTDLVDRGKTRAAAGRRTEAG